MKYRWFVNITDPEGIKKQYHDLVKEFHPDAPNGSKEIFQEINAEYKDIIRKPVKKMKLRINSEQAEKITKAASDLTATATEIFMNSLFEKLKR